MKRIGKALRAIILIFTGIMVIGRADIQAAGLLKPIGHDACDVQMKTHRVNVTINNGFARTEVDQIFFNPGDRDLEAVYTFPVPAAASLSEVSLWIDGREIIGEVLAKEKAHKTYQEQKVKGNNAALAEKNDFKTFDIKVYPVRAGQDTRVRLVYYQPLSIDLNIGRYVYPLEEGGVDEERVAFWSVDDVVSEQFTFQLHLKSAFPVKDVRVPHYQTQAIVQKKDAKDDAGNGDIYEVNLDYPEGGTLSQEIVVYYRLEDTAPARVELIPYHGAGAKQGTFMAVVTPGAALQPISSGTDWTFVLNVSGSMGGNKISTLVDGVSRVIDKMSSSDRFRIVTFNDQATDFTRGYIPATRENVVQTLEKIKKIQAGGGTALYAGMEKGYEGLDEDRISGIILVTDGVANVGLSQHADLLKLHRAHDFRLFTFIIGNSANQPLLETLATESGGFAMNISSSDDIIGRIIQAKAKVMHECLYDARLRFAGETVTDLTPNAVRNLYIGQQFTTFGRYTGSGKVTLEFTGKIAGKEQVWRCEAVLPVEDTDNPEIERLWALSAIEDTMSVIRDKGETDILREKVIALGTEYSLVTDYTSMLVINDMELENMGLQRKNADRVNRERQAQSKRKGSPVTNYQVDRQPAGNNGESSSGMFGNASAPNIGSGPVGPLFLIMVGWLVRRKNKHQ